MIVTDVPIGPATGERPVIVGRTEKFTPLLATPLAVTTTGPVEAFDGTGAAMDVSLQLVGVAVTPLNVTVLAPCVAPKADPLIVTEVPGTPDVGDKPEMLGAKTSGIVTVES